MGLLRLGLIIVLCWIGGLKFADCEADGIVPLVANSPLMSFFYDHPAPEYRQYMNKEGEVVPAHQQWHKSNGTYSFSHGLGVVIVLIGVLIAAYPIMPQVSAVGSCLLILMSLTTLSFLVTTPEAWVSALGAFTHGVPASLGNWPADHQGRHHAGCRGGDSRRLGQDLVMAQSVTAIGRLKLTPHRHSWIG